MWQKLECECREEGIHAKLQVGTGILSFRFTLNLSGEKPLGAEPEKSAAVFDLGARLHNSLCELGGEEYAHVRPIAADGLAEQVLADRKTIQ